MSVHLFSPSTFTYCLKQADDFCDYVPLVSTISEICDLFLKCMISLSTGLGLIDKSKMLKNYYWAHIHHKDLTRCLWGLIPIVGNLAVWSMDRGANTHSRNEESDLFVHTVQEAKPAERPALARRLYEENRNDFYANVGKLRLNATDLEQIPLGKGTRKEAEDLIRNIKNMPAYASRFDLAKKCVDLAPAALGENLHKFSLSSEQNGELASSLFDKDPVALLVNFYKIFLSENSKSELAKKYQERSVTELCANIDKFRLQPDATATIVESLMQNPQANFAAILENYHRFNLDDKTKVTLMEYYKGTVTITEFCQNIGKFHLSRDDTAALVDSLLSGRAAEDANLRPLADNINRFNLSYEKKLEWLKHFFEQEYDYIYRRFEVQEPLIKNLEKFDLYSWDKHALIQKVLRHYPVLLIVHWDKFFPGETPEAVQDALSYFFCIAGQADFYGSHFKQHVEKLHLTPAIISVFIDDPKNYLGSDNQKSRIIKALLLCCPEAAPALLSRLDKFSLSDQAKAELQTFISTLN